MTTSTIDAMLATALRQIAQAAEKGDLATVTAETRKAAELQEMKNTMLGIEEKLKGLQSTPQQKPTNLRELAVEVSDGMIRQNLLTLTQHVKRGRIKIGENLTIEAQPSGEIFRTELLENGNKLRERGAVARFYREAGVRPWNFVELNEVSPNRWILKKAEPGKYKGRQAILDSL